MSSLTDLRMDFDNDCTILITQWLKKKGMCCVLLKATVLTCLMWTRRGNRGWDNVGEGERQEKKSKRLTENMGAINTHLGMKNRGMMKAKVERKGRTDRHRQTESEG